MPPKIITISESTRANKKLMATTEQHGEKKVAHFGQRGSEDYTTTKDTTLRDMYIARHNPLSGENWGKIRNNDPWLASSLYLMGKGNRRRCRESRLEEICRREVSMQTRAASTE